MSEHLKVLVGDGPARYLLERFGSVRAIMLAEPREYESVPGIGPKTARRLHASFALAREGMRQTGVKAITCVEQAKTLFGEDMHMLDHEQLRAAYLNRRHAVLDVRIITRGNDQFTIVDPRQILRPAVRLGATAVILAHNHPSGNPRPSHQDRSVTERVIRASHMLGICVLDHIVFGGGSSYSMADEGKLSFSSSLDLGRTG